MTGADIDGEALQAYSRARRSLPPVSELPDFLPPIDVAAFTTSLMATAGTEDSIRTVALPSIAATKILN